MISPRSPRTSTMNEMNVLELQVAASRIPFKKIRVGPVISRGGYGEVLRGTYNGRAVAIKRLLIARREDESRIDHLVKEIVLTATLHHERIVTFVGYAWDTPSNLCMISELMTGGDVRSLLVNYHRRGIPTGFTDTKLQIAAQVASGLAYLHGRDPIVVHRDLKSRNILLTSDLNAKLTDFGVSTARHDYTLTAGVGTSLWMAPEVILGDRYNEKADIYSFGVLLSELDTHELPYAETRGQDRGRSVNELLMMQLICQGRMTPRFTENADPAIVKVARDCLQLDPSRRPSSADILDRIHRIWRGSSTIY